MIYTSYLANKSIPKRAIKTMVTRYVPKSVRVSSIRWNPQLAPEEDLLKEYKNGNISWEDYRIQFLEYARNNESFNYTLQCIINCSEGGRDVYLLCYEKDDSKCHRSLIREILIEKGIDCEEFKNKY